MGIQTQSESLIPKEATNENECSVDVIGRSVDGNVNGLTVEQLLVEIRILKKEAEILRTERDFWKNEYCKSERNGSARD